MLIVKILTPLDIIAPYILQRVASRECNPYDASYAPKSSVDVVNMAHHG